MGWRRSGVVAGVLALAFTRGAVASDAPLADAAEGRDAAAVRDLLGRGVEVNQTQADGMTALHWAAYHDDLESARALLKAGADAKRGNEYGAIPLSAACTNGDAAMVGLLLDAGADPNAPLRGGETPLMTAARTGVVGPVKVLLAKGATVDARERRGQTALMWAAAEGNVEVIQVLLAAGADLKASLPSGFTPLAFAVRQGKMGAVKTLLAAGADAKAAMEPKRASGRNPDRGTSPLILAIENGHYEIALLLIDAGADPNDRRTGYTPLHMMTWVRKPNRGDGLDGDPPPAGSGTTTSLDFVRALVGRGADVNARLAKGSYGHGPVTRPGATPLLMAAFTDDVAYMKLLVELGADPKLTDDRETTALMLAAGVGSLAPEEEAGTEPEACEAVAYALELGGDVNAVDRDGETAMHGAAYKNLPAVVQLLADRGAKADVWDRKNRHGWTPLLIAEGHRPGNFKPSAATIDALKRVMPAPAAGDTGS